MILHITHGVSDPDAQVVSCTAPSGRDTINCTDSEIDEFLVTLPYNLPITNPTIFNAFLEWLQTKGHIASSASVYYWGITGRIPDDDEDTACVFGPCTDDQARLRFISTLYEDRFTSPTARAEARKTTARQHGVAAYVSSMFSSETAITRTV